MLLTKLSRSLKSFLKNLLFLTLILAASFGGGFYFGAFPDALLENLGLYKGKLRWICIAEVCPSPQTLLEIQKNTQIEFQMIETLSSAEDLRSTSLSADVIIATRPMLNAIKEELSVFDESQLETVLHPDFQSFALNDRVGFPLFWKFEKKEKEPRKIVRIYSLGFFQESKLSEKQKDIFIQSLLDHDVQISWMKEQNLSATLGEFDQSNEIKPEQKPSILRTFRLQDLVIEE